MSGGSPKLPRDGAHTAEKPQLYKAQKQAKWRKASAGVRQIHLMLQKSDAHSSHLQKRSTLVCGKGGR